jgi:DNA-binding protein Alba
MAEKADDNTIFVGKKPTMSYVLAAITQLGKNKEVHVRARGRSISTAVDVAEVVKNKFMQGIKNSVQIGTEQVTDKDSRTLNVSTIEITLTK